jgi:uncharacterized protein YndB with AHSA1/START domain
MTTDNFSRMQTAGAADVQAADNETPERADLELHFTRVFNAPRPIVFRAWTDPEQAVHWYGPKDFTVDIIEMDVRVGGAWRKRMRSPEGIDYWRHGIYREVVEPERLVFTYVSDDPHGLTGHETLVTIDFLDRGGKTLMVFKQAVFESVATRDSHRGGWGSSMDRLAVWVDSRRD